MPPSKKIVVQTKSKPLTAKQIEDKKEFKYICDLIENNIDDNLTLSINYRIPFKGVPYETWFMYPKRMYAITDSSYLFINAANCTSCLHTDFIFISLRMNKPIDKLLSKKVYCSNCNKLVFTITSSVNFTFSHKTMRTERNHLTSLQKLNIIKQFSDNISVPDIAKQLKRSFVSIYQTIRTFFYKTSNHKYLHSLGLHISNNKEQYDQFITDILLGNNMKTLLSKYGKSAIKIIKYLIERTEERTEDDIIHSSFLKIIANR